MGWAQERAKHLKEDMKLGEEVFPSGNNAAMHILAAALLEAEARGALAEREACARLLDEKADEFRERAADARDRGLEGSAGAFDADAELLSCGAAAIRARGKEGP